MESVEITYKDDPVFEFCEYLRKRGGWVSCAVMARGLSNWVSGCYATPNFALQAAIRETYGD